MERVALLGGSYTARWVGSNAQRCVNYYPEKNPQGSLTEYTLYQRPGLVPKYQGAGPVRALYRPSTGVGGYVVTGADVWFVPPNGALSHLGTITLGRSNPVSMTDNGTDLLLADGSGSGWQITLATNAFAPFVDPTGTFTGATRLDTIDTFIIWNQPGTQQFASTLSGSLVIDPTYIAGKVVYPDLLQTLIVNNHEILLLGSLKSEVWYDAGNAQFPFAQLPGAYIEHGIAATYSLASSDISVFWLGQDLQGRGFVFRRRGYQTTRISNHALEYAIRQMVTKGADISDAIGYTYQQDGHLFYVLGFASGDQTWVFDDSIGEPTMAWHQRGWTDANGVLHRDRTNCAGFINGMNLVGDWENGTIYELDLNTYIDTVAEQPGPVTCIRSFPHIGIGAPSRALFVPPVAANGRRMQFSAFYADMEVGTSPGAVGLLPPQVSLRWSTDRGRTWGNAVLQSAGKLGEYLTEPTWRAEGIARDMVFELSHSIPGPAALNGAWVEAQVLGT